MHYCSYHLYKIQTDNKSKQSQTTSLKIIQTLLFIIRILTMPLFGRKYTGFGIKNKMCRNILFFFVLFNLLSAN